VDSGFHDFDLDVKTLNYPPVAEEILIQYLARKRRMRRKLLSASAASMPKNRKASS